MNRIMAVIEVLRDIYRRESFEHIPSPERWNMRMILLSYRDIHRVIEIEIRLQNREDIFS